MTVRLCLNGVWHLSFTSRSTAALFTSCFFLSQLEPPFSWVVRRAVDCLTDIWHPVIETFVNKSSGGRSSTQTYQVQKFQEALSALLLSLLYCTRMEWWLFGERFSCQTWISLTWSVLFDQSVFDVRDIDKIFPLSVYLTIVARWNRLLCGDIGSCLCDMRRSCTITLWCFGWWRSKQQRRRLWWSRAWLRWGQLRDVV